MCLVTVRKPPGQSSDPVFLHLTNVLINQKSNFLLMSRGCGKPQQVEKLSTELFARASLHLHPRVWPSESTTHREPHLYHLRSRVAHLMRFPQLTCVESVETTLGKPTFLSFCGLFDIHYPLSSSMTPFPPSPTPPSHSTSIPCES